MSGIEMRLNGRKITSASQPQGGGYQLRSQNRRLQRETGALFRSRFFAHHGCSAYDRTLMQSTGLAAPKSLVSQFLIMS